MLFVMALVPFLLFVRLVVVHGARVNVLALVYAPILIIILSLVAAPLIACLAAALVGSALGALSLHAVNQLKGAAYFVATAATLLPPYLAIETGLSVQHFLEVDACLDAGGQWTDGECHMGTDAR